jgi:serine O-acetyltransferase
VSRWHLRSAAQRTSHAATRTYALVGTLASIRADYRNHGRSLLHPAVCALATYRVGRWSLSGRTPAHKLVSKLYGALCPLVRFATGMTMDRSMTMGRDLVLHPGGAISIHPHATLGERVEIMPNVTLGATPDDGVPTIGDDVLIGAGAVVIGRVVVGHGARIAANSLVISDVPPHHVAMGVPARHRSLR